MHNDYICAVYGYLKNYHILKGQADNIARNIKTITEEIAALTDAKISRYGNDQGGGFDELAPVERKFVQKQELDAKLYAAKVNLQNVALAVWRVNNALEFLAELPKTIVKMRFIERKNWTQISLDTGYSDSSCRRILRGAVTEMTHIIFPESATEPYLDFVFFPHINSDVVDNTDGAKI